MKKTLRSALALMLVLCLVAGLCPAAFATSIGDYSQQEILAKLVALYQEFWPEADPTVDPNAFVSYEPKDTSYYVALGDSSVSDSEYVTRLAQELGVESRNLGKEDMVLADETYAVIENNVKDIRNADLISLGYGAHVFLNNGISEGMSRAALPITSSSAIKIDWVGLLGQEYANDVNALLNAIRAKVAQKVTNETVQEAIMGIIEGMAYSAAVYAVHLPGIIEAIRALNPTATIVLVGMYNPIENVSIDMGMSDLDIEEYMDSIMEAMDSHASACAASTPACTYITAYSAETQSEASGESVTLAVSTNPIQVWNVWRTLRTKLTPSEAGSKYIMNRILLGVVPTFRVAGQHRYETATKAADMLKASMDVKRFDSIIIACGEDPKNPDQGFADALSASYLATEKGAPILLSYFNPQNSLKNYNDEIIDYVKANLSSDGLVYIIGGYDAVPESLDKGLARNKYTVKRLYGSNRLETNLEVLKYAGVGTKDILVCTGWNYGDALAASATGLPILLVYSQYDQSKDQYSYKMTDSQTAYLKALNGRNDFYIIGGEKAVCNDLMSKLTEYSKKVERIYGDGRVETSVAIADEFFDTPDKVALAFGWKYPDALCAGPLAYSMDAPLLLTHELRSYVVSEYVSALDIERGVIMGGEGTLSQTTADASFGK